MKIARLFCIGLALLCTAVASQARAGVTGLIYDLQIDQGGISDHDGYGLAVNTDYSVSSDNKTFSLLPGFGDDIEANDPNDLITVKMRVYADVLDQGNQLAGYSSLVVSNTGTSNNTYHPFYVTGAASNTSTCTLTKATTMGLLPVGYNGNSSNFYMVSGNSHCKDSGGHGIDATLGDPMPALGINTATLSFARTDTQSALVGDIASSSINAQVAQAFKTTGVQVANGNGGNDLGPATSGASQASYWSLSMGGGTVNPMQSNFEYVSFTSNNPNNGSNVYSTVSLNGSTYAQVYLGEVSFTFAASAAANGGAMAAINANPMNYTSGNYSGNYWMQSTDNISGGTTNSVSYASQATGNNTVATPGALGSVAFSTTGVPNVPSGSAGLAITGSYDYNTGSGLTSWGNAPRALAGAHLLVSFTCTNTGAAATSDVVTVSGVGLGAFNPTSVTSSDVMNPNDTLSYSGTYAVPTSPGTDNITVAGSVAGNDLPVDFTNSISVVSSRTFTNGSISLGRILAGVALGGGTTGTISSLAQANSVTQTVTLYAASAGSIKGLSLSGAGGTFDGNTTQATYTLGGVPTAGQITGTLSINGSDEFGDSLSGAAGITLSGTAVTQRGYTGGTLNLGRLLAGATLTNVPFNSPVTSSGNYSTTTSAALTAFTTGTLTGFTPTAINGSGTFVTGSETVSGSLSGTVRGSAGQISGILSASISDELAGNTTFANAITVTGSAVVSRVLTLPNNTDGVAAPDAGVIPNNILRNSVWNYTVNGPGASSVTSNPTVTSGSYSDPAGTGITLLTSAGTFTGTSTNQTVGLKFTAYNSALDSSGTIPLSSLITNGQIHGEAGLNETPSVDGSAFGYSTSSGGSINVGYATASVSGSVGKNAAFGTSLSALVQAGGTYQGLASTVSGGSGNLGTVATILYGTASADATPTMAWRTRAKDEKPGTSSGVFLASDVVQVTGIGATSGTTDTYVLQMTYDPTQFAPKTDQQAFTSGYLYLGTMDTNGKWVKATSLNTGTVGLYASLFGAETGSGYAGSFDAYMLAVEGYATGHGDNNPVTLAEVFGAYGAQTSTNGGPEAWAVVNHDSEFAVVPEPGTLALLACGGLVLIPVIRRRFRKG